MYKLHYAQNGVNYEDEDIACLQFNEKELIVFIEKTTKKLNTVFLATYQEDGKDEEICISANSDTIIDFFDSILMNNKSIKTFFLQEYYSFEAAYEVALMMKEATTHLCYKPMKK